MNLLERISLVLGKKVAALPTQKNRRHLVKTESLVDDQGSRFVLMSVHPEKPPIIVDESDFEILSSASWCVMKNGYAALRGKFGLIYLHRVIVNATRGEIVDHKNRNKLDCRKSNLRKVDSTQNLYNTPKRSSCVCTSKFKGVWWDSRKNAWGSQISLPKRKRIWLGYHDSEIEAAKRYDIAAKKHFGEFACINFP